MPSEDSAASIEATAMRVAELIALVRRDGQVSRLMWALADIADADYRGNRSPEAIFAQRVLVEEGFRAE